MNTREAEDFMRYLISVVGAGYHPDTRLSEYVDRVSGKSTFPAPSALQRKHDEMMTVLSDPYEVSVRLFKSLGYL